MLKAKSLKSRRRARDLTAAQSFFSAGRKTSAATSFRFKRPGLSFRAEFEENQGCKNDHLANLKSSSFDGDGLPARATLRSTL
jgi:hypothetical protein